MASVRYSSQLAVSSPSFNRHSLAWQSSKYLLGPGSCKDQVEATEGESSCALPAIKHPHSRFCIDATTPAHATQLSPLRDFWELNLHDTLRPRASQPRPNSPAISAKTHRSHRTEVQSHRAPQLSAMYDYNNVNVEEQKEMLRAIGIFNFVKLKPNNNKKGFARVLEKWDKENFLKVAAYEERPPKQDTEGGRKGSLPNNPSRSPHRLQQPLQMHRAKSGSAKSHRQHPCRR
jgi:hypothetical protein